MVLSLLWVQEEKKPMHTDAKKQIHSSETIEEEEKDLRRVNIPVEADLSFVLV